MSPSSRYQSVEALQTALDELSGEAKTRVGKSNWKKYLLPGFRSTNVVTWLFSAVGYAALICVCIDLQVDNAGPIELIINRTTFTIMSLCIVLFNGNYLNVQRNFILTRSKKKWVRWLGMGIVDFALVALWVIVTDLLVSIFAH